jgi:hypothetical protein
MLKNECFFCNINANFKSKDGSCSCSNSVYYTYMSHSIGCQDCTYIDPNCEICANKEKC